jgi:hypothetical protein
MAYVAKYIGGSSFEGATLMEYHCGGRAACVGRGRVDELASIGRGSSVDGKSDECPLCKRCDRQNSLRHNFRRQA